MKQRKQSGGARAPGRGAGRSAGDASTGGRSPRLLILSALALTLSACGGSGSGGNPTVSGLMSQTIDQDTPTAPIPFTVSDDGGVDGLMLSVSSSNNAVVRPEGIVLAGSGANRTVTVTPAEGATGSVTITVGAQDAGGRVGSSAFVLTVRAVEQSISSYTLGTFAQGENDTPAKVSGFTFVQDADESTFAPLLQ